MKERQSNEQKTKTIKKKKGYTPPELKRYTRPTLRKHQSYKDITRLSSMPVVS